MVSIRSILAATGLYVAVSFAAPFQSTPHTETHRLTKRVADSYTTYYGNGTVAAGWPDVSKWYQSFDQMFRANANAMSTSCARVHNTINNSQDEMNNLYDAIRQVAQETGVDNRYILAIILKESTGCVRVKTTTSPGSDAVRNPGMMQSHNGSGTCNDNGTVQNPCPKAQILQMVRDGTAGTSSGEGLKGALARQGATDVSKYYRASRLYNSGNIDSSNDLGRGIATHCYCSNIANHLTGWINAASTCSEDTVGNGGKATGPPAEKPKYPYAVSNCKKWYTTVSGDYCSLIASKNSITLDQFYSYNRVGYPSTGIDSSCSNLWADTQYCVGV